MIRNAFICVCLLFTLNQAAMASYQEELAGLRDRLQSLQGRQTNRSDAERFQALVDIGYDYTMLSYPEFATYRGDPRGADRWTDYSEEAVEQRKQDERSMLGAIESIDPSRLAAKDRLNYALYRDQIQRDVDGQQFPDEYMPLTQLNGVHQDPAQLMAVIQPKTADDYRNIIARLEKLPQLIDQTIDWLRKGLKAGITPPAITLRDVPQQIRNQIAGAPASSALLVAFRKFPDGVEAATQQALQQQAAAVYIGQVVPAYEKLLTFMEKEYLPAARQTIGLSDLPDGKAWYAYKVRTQTTTSLSPQEIHRIGLAEVKRIRGEMDRVIRDSGFKGDFKDFTEFLRTDPRFYHKTAAGLLRAYRDIAKRADPELMKLFGKLPRTPYGVRPVPAYAEKSQTTAYYQGGSVKAGRPGYFYANTYALDTRPSWEMEALTLHEAVPGHHLQLSLQDELQDVPWFRRIGRYTAFIEGWGLYSEGLGERMGFYTDPYSKFGQLTYEMWRAVRLVVDTGMHQLGWSRQQAIDYFLANTGKQKHDIVVEIDRYIVWPGQALAYKIGELKIKELRRWAHEQLGEKFDIRAFHDHVLGQGALPLNLLEEQIHEWVKEEQDSST